MPFNFSFLYKCQPLNKVVLIDQKYLNKAGSSVPILSYELVETLCLSVLIDCTK